VETAPHHHGKLAGDLRTARHDGTRCSAAAAAFLPSLTHSRQQPSFFSGDLLRALIGQPPTDVASRGSDRFVCFSLRRAAAVMAATARISAAAAKIDPSYSLLKAYLFRKSFPPWTGMETFALRD